MGRNPTKINGDRRIVGWKIATMNDFPSLNRFRSSTMSLP